MQELEPSILLKQLILETEAEYRLEGKILKDHFHQTYESLKPINLIKDTLKEAISSPDIKANMVNAAIGLTTGFIGKKVFVGKSDNQLKKLTGAILEMVIASKVTKNADEIKAIVKIVARKIINHTSDLKETSQ